MTSQWHFSFLAFACILLLVTNTTTTVSPKAFVTTLPGFHGPLPFTLETGYVSVGQGENVQLFYYFVESQASPEHDPLILWLAGGPGCSALVAFFYEIGPFTFDKANFSEIIPTLELNPYSWAQIANVIFLDQPVGTGYSYSRTWEDSRSSDTLSTTQVYDFLRKWLMDHPRFLNNPLYVAGVSYAGVIIPNIVLQIYNGNERGNEPILNIKGYMMGNPVTDKQAEANSRLKYAHDMALISDELYESTRENCHGNYIASDSNDKLCSLNLQMVDECTSDINLAQILEPYCRQETTTRNLLNQDESSIQEYPINLSQSPYMLKEPWCRSKGYEFSVKWATDKTVQKALHVREGTKEWVRCNMSIFYIFGLEETPSYSYDVPSSLSYHQQLLDKHCRAMIFSGDHDMIVPHTSTTAWIRTLNLSTTSAWKPWFVQNQVAGYVETYALDRFSLTFATVKGAGHTGPEYKPKECLAMVDRWFSYQDL